MSTHFRPRPSPAPPSPVRPSTAHSTIRAVPPSPPDSRDEERKSPAAFQLQFLNQRPSSPPEDGHDLSVEQAATLAAKEHETEAPRPNSPHQDVTERSVSPLKRGGVNSGRNSPVKARSGSPQKKPVAAPTQAPTQAPEQATSIRDSVRNTPVPQQESEDEEDLSRPPYTPSPLPRHERKRAYLPLGHSSTTSNLKITTSSQTQIQHHPCPQNFLPTRQPITRIPLLTYSNSHSKPSSPPRPAPQRSTSNRVSNSGSAISRQSVFSTPGRDEMERKKALVEADEGPFARVTSMSDLDDERRRVSGMKGAIKRGKGDGNGNGKSRGLQVGNVCGKGCIVM